jgi:hypothetical protein
VATQARRPGAALLVGALVVVAVVGSALAGPFRLAQRGGQTDVRNRPQTFDTPTSTPDPAGPFYVVRAPAETHRWIYLVVLVALALLLAVGFRLLVRWLRSLTARRAPYGDDVAEPAGELAGDVEDHATPALREGVRRAAQVLEDEVPPGDAVIAAWVALEASAERTGLVRDRAQTATEFTVEVLDATRADPGATRTLLELYLAARYSEHVLTTRDVDQARSSLAAIAVDLTRRAQDA